MLNYFLRRPWRTLLAALAVAAITTLLGLWKSNSDNGGQKPAEPFRIAGNLYYVGANDVAAFLITGPAGHVLIDGGYPGTAPMIMASIRKLGFDIHDVKVLLNSEPHFDHAGGLATLQKASGAQFWVSDLSAEAIASGGDDPYGTFLPMRLLIKSGLASYPAPHIDHRFSDGAVIRLGPTALTAHITGGHTHGCTTWTFPVREGDRELQVVSACSLTLLPGMRFTEPQRYPGIRHDFERTFQILRSLPADIWVTSHAREFGRYRKFLARTSTKTPADAFIDPTGYHQYIDAGEKRFRAELERQQKER